MKPSLRIFALEWGFRAVLMVLALFWMLYPPHASISVFGELIRVIQP